MVCLRLLMVITLALLASGCGDDRPVVQQVPPTPTAPRATPAMPDLPGVVTSEGTSAAGDQQSSQPGLVDSGAPTTNDGPEPTSAPTSPTEATVQVPTDWQRYRNAEYAFQIDYPPALVILDEPEPFAAIAEQLLWRVRFQERSLAAGEFAQLEPAQFSVEVFANTPTLPLEQWLDQQPIQGQRSAQQIAGQPGYRLQASTLMAPNTFYFVAHGSFVYRLIPLSTEAEQMLGSLVLLPLP
jgi:hypothetical protein